MSPQLKSFFFYVVTPIVHHFPRLLIHTPECPLKHKQIIAMLFEEAKKTSEKKVVNSHARTNLPWRVRRTSASGCERPPGRRRRRNTGSRSPGHAGAFPSEPRRSTRWTRTGTSGYPPPWRAASPTARGNACRNTGCKRRRKEFMLKKTNFCVVNLCQKDWREYILVSTGKT